jgi:DNA-directed RNA polymerase specialized sigma subunit
MPRLLQNERERAVGMFQAGMTQTEIANHLNCSRMTIYQLLVRVRALQLQTTQFMTFNYNRAHLHTF